MTTYNLKPMDNRKSFYGKAKVEERDDGSKVLYSYGTAVCGLTVSGRFFRAWGGYSATTMRHVNSFLRAEGVDGGGLVDLEGPGAKAPGLFRVYWLANECFILLIEWEVKAMYNLFIGSYEKVMGVTVYYKKGKKYIPCVVTNYYFKSRKYALVPIADLESVPSERRVIYTTKIYTA